MKDLLPVLRVTAHVSVVVLAFAWLVQAGQQGSVSDALVGIGFAVLAASLQPEDRP